MPDPFGPDSVPAPERIVGRRVTVVGMARSGLAAAELIKRHGGEPFVTDGAPAEALAGPSGRLEESGIPFEAGGHSDAALDADYVVASPGVPPRAAILVAAADAGLSVYSELELASWVCKAPILAVTGTNGKTTTTALCGEMLRAGGVANAVCGNIGVPFSTVVDDLPTDAVAAVEVSSYQLHAVDSFRPRVAIVTNLQPDHLDWHGSLDAYYAAKWRISENQLSGDALVYNGDDPIIDPGAIPGGAARLGFSVGDRRDDLGAFTASGSLDLVVRGEEHRVLPVAEVRLPGRHNLANAAAAALAVSWLGIQPDAIAEALRGFSGVEHRLEPAGDVGGVSFVNDSKATNVDAVCVALEAMDRPVRLIMGGRDKGAPYEPIARAARGKVRGFILIGEAADRIESELRQASSDPPAIERSATLDEAVRLALSRSEPGDVVLLSPACSSFDMFSDFEDRGRSFKRSVEALGAEERI